MRRLLAAFLCVACASACAYQSPTAPPPAATPTIASLTASVDRTHVPFPVGPVTLSILASATGGSPEGLPVDVVMRLDGIVDELRSQVRLDREGRASSVFNFGKPGTLIVGSNSFKITQDAAPSPANPNPPPQPGPQPPPNPGPVVAVALSHNSASPDIFTDVTFMASATSFNGAAEVTSYAWDFDGDGIVDRTTATNVQAFRYSSVGTRTARVTVSNGTQTASNVTTVAVDHPAMSVTLTSNIAAAGIGQNITFTASASSNGPMDSLRFDWSDDGSGDEAYEVTGPTTASNTATHQKNWNVAGQRRVRVRVTNLTTGRAATAVVTVTIS